MKRCCDTRIQGVAHTATHEEGKKRNRAIRGASVLCITFYYSCKKLVTTVHLEHNACYYFLANTMYNFQIAFEHFKIQIASWSMLEFDIGTWKSRIGCSQPTELHVIGYLAVVPFRHQSTMIPWPWQHAWDRHGEAIPWLQCMVPPFFNVACRVNPNKRP
jgi:hypothetical protein